MSIYEACGVLALTFRVFGANVVCEVVVHLQFKGLQDFLQGLARRGTRELEDPGALGAAPAGATGFSDPYQLARHM